MTCHHACVSEADLPISICQVKIRSFIGLDQLCLGEAGFPSPQFPFVHQQPTISFHITAMCCCKAYPLGRVPHQQNDFTSSRSILYLRLQLHFGRCVMYLQFHDDITHLQLTICKACLQMLSLFANMHGCAISRWESSNTKRKYRQHVAKLLKKCQTGCCCEAT